MRPSCMAPHVCSETEPFSANKVRQINKSRIHRHTRGPAIRAGVKSFAGGFWLRLDGQWRVTLGSGNDFI